MYERIVERRGRDPGPLVPDILEPDCDDTYVAQMSIAAYSIVSGSKRKRPAAHEPLQHPWRKPSPTC